MTEARANAYEVDSYLKSARDDAKARANRFGKPVAIWLTVPSAGKDRAYTLRNVEESMDETLWAYYGVMDPDQTCPACGRHDHVVCNKGGQA